MSQDDFVEKLVDFLDRYYREAIGQLAQRYPKEETALEVDFADLQTYDSQIADDFLIAPETILDHLQEALARYDLPAAVDLSEAVVRISNLPHTRTYPVGMYDPNQIVDQLIGIRGQVSKRSERMLNLQEAAYECLRCGTYTTIIPEPNNLQQPHECQGCERQGPFRLDKSESKKIAYQELRLQVPPEEAVDAGGDRIDIRLEGDLVGSANPGDRIIVNAHARTELQSKDKPILDLYGEAHSIERLDTTIDDVDVGPYKAEIEEIAHSENPYEQIIGSIAPSHRGDTLIKEAIAYQLFGGVNQTLPDGSLKRGTPHVLLIGDPGCGKSGLLRYASRLAPRSVYTTGMGSTAAGLTCAAVQDDFGGGGWTLEAGALVEAHTGLAAIDELDKMDQSDQHGLQEAMSDQTISVSKAGITTTLPAQTTVLAAANPTNGRFNRHDHMAAQIGIDPVLLSRFDLVFTLSDSPDEEQDREIAAHMNEVAKTAQRIAAGETVTDSEIVPTIDPETLRAYIAHSRTIHPVLTPEADQLIVDEYASIRQANGDDGPIPTTARDNAAVVRLAEAAARIRLSETIEIEDVKRVLRIRRACLADIGIDPDTGEFDADIIETGTSKSQRDRKTLVKKTAEELEGLDDGPGAPKQELIEAVMKAGFSREQIEHDLQGFRDRGEAYDPKHGRMKFI